MLPAIDQDFLAERFRGFTVTPDANMIAVVLPGLHLPPGFQVETSDLLLRLAPGYPDVQPDMWWFSPAVLRRDGMAIRNTDIYENYLGRSWQRWSRHLAPGQWKPGIDCLESFMAVVAGELRTSTRGLAA